MRSLGRLVPPDFEHVARYALTPETLPTLAVPVIGAFNWYSNFDDPVRDGQRWYVGRGSLGSIRGGHCIALKDGAHIDYRAWYPFYNQGAEGACTGFGTSRVMSLLNRKRYDGFWLYHEGQKHGGYLGEEGAYIRDVVWVAINEGLERAGGSAPLLSDGLTSVRWASSVDEVHAALRYPLADKIGCVPILNSWGTDYPHIVWMTDDALARVMSEDGEFGVPTDR